MRAFPTLARVYSHRTSLSCSLILDSLSTSSRHGLSSKVIAHPHCTELHSLQRSSFAECCSLVRESFTLEKCLAEVLKNPGSVFSWWYRGTCNSAFLSVLVLSCDCIHTLTCYTHIFLHIARAQSHLHTSHACHTHAWLKLKSCQKGVCCTCIIPLHLAFSISCFTHLCCSCTSTSTSPFSPQSCRTFPS